MDTLDISDISARLIRSLANHSTFLYLYLKWHKIWGMENTINRLDPIIGRLLFVTPEPVADETEPGKKSERVMGYSLAFSAGRCILQYVLLPFILPFIGIAASWALGLTMIVNIAAIVAIVASVRRMWQIQYSHRWRYMGLAVPAFLLLISFLVLDIYTLAQG